MSEARRPESTAVILRGIAVAAYGPTLLASVGAGAVAPIIAVSARGLGAPVGLAALLVGAMGLGQVVGDLPSGALAARIGERRALALAALVEAGGMLLAARATSLPALFAGVVVVGLAGSLFGLARQAYLTDAVPIRMRARALSTLGGVHRIGYFLGPFLGSLVVARWGTGAAYAVGAVASLGALALVLSARDITADHGGLTTGRRRSVSSVLREHRHVLLTLGTGAMAVAGARAVREALVPLWAESVGLSPAQTSLVFGIAGAVDMVLFYPSGWVMDRFGRAAVAVPAMVILGLGMVALPFAHTFAAVTVVAMALGLGNGISSGLIMTLGADASPADERSQFLGAWRLMADVGRAGGPFALSAAGLVLTLGSSAVLLGMVAVAGAAWLAHWAPRYDPRVSKRRGGSPTF